MSSGGAPGPVVALPTGFEFVRLLGSGGGGWVALTRQTDLDRLVAVKRLFGAGRDSRLIGLLRDEGRALAALRHPAVVQVYDLLRMGEDAALVMEYVRGDDLRGLLDTSTASAAHRAGIVLDVASALVHAHEAGIIHCDVKPGNVLVGEDGRAKLADFGIARLGRSPGMATQGTPRYMAPEQRAGRATLTVAADTYAFALLVRETLLGTDPSVTGPCLDLPRKLSRLLDSALAPDPDDRPSVRRLGECLAAVPAATWDRLLPRGTTPAPRPLTAGALETIGAAVTALAATSPAPTVTSSSSSPPSSAVSSPLASMRPQGRRVPRLTGLPTLSRRHRSWQRICVWALGAAVGVAGTLIVLATHR